MMFLLRLSCALATSLCMAAAALSQEPRAAASSSNPVPAHSPAVTTDTLPPLADIVGNTSSDDKAKAATNEPAISDPLIRVLIAKGIITADEGRAAASGNAVEQRDRLAALLRDKGLISATEFDELRAAAPMMVVASAAGQTQQQGTPQNPPGQVPQGQQGQPGAQRPEGPATQPRTAAPNVIAAIAPIRALQSDAPKRDSLIPDIKLGSGAKLKLYGFFKASVVHDSSSPGGNDFPLPLFLGDTGPEGSPEFHIKARSFRMGANFEWLDPSPKLSLTGRLEFDFEGDFARANNRNIASIRSNSPSLRLAWARVDRTFSDKTTGFLLFGQDWTPFGSSTLPNLIETTGLGIAFGSLYQRAPQIRGGFNYNLGTKRNLRFLPEVAIVLPGFGNLPSDTGNQLGFGERQGADADRPEVQGRFVVQFQLDKAPGVVPAQLIASFTQGERKAIVRAGDVPAAFRAAFPGGAEVESSRYGYTAEAQLPTRFATVIAKYYNGQDLRFYFAGQLFSTFNDTAGLTATATAPSIDGSSTVVFGLENGVGVVAPQRPVRSQGGFINIGFPLSRIFGADPKGRYAGFTSYLHYGYDQALARDVRRFTSAGNRARSDLFSANLQYRINTFLTFAYEQSLYRTHATSGTNGIFPLFRGVPSSESKNIRSEFATIFTF